MNCSYFEVYLVVDLIPMIDVGDHHPATGDGHSLVGVPVDNIDLLVAIGRQCHGEPSPILCEHWRLLQLQPPSRTGHHQAVLTLSLQSLTHTDHAVVLMSVLPGQSNLILGWPGHGVDDPLSVIEVAGWLQLHCSG